MSDRRGWRCIWFGCLIDWPPHEAPRLIPDAEREPEDAPPMVRVSVAFLRRIVGRAGGTVEHGPVDEHGNVTHLLVNVPERGPDR